VNHFKSMLDQSDYANGRRNTRARRALQADTVKDIVKKRFGASPGQHPWIVLGDLNDYLDTDAQGETAIKSLVRWNQVENVVERLPAGEQWTHYFAGSGRALPDAYRQLDYVLLSRSLADANGGPPEMLRKGMSSKADRYTGSRFPNVTDDLKASDHAPIVMELTI
jgi:predicted extracellular nuclease